MSGQISEQTRRNRSAAGRKAAAAKSAQRRKYGPNGTHRGSAPVAWVFAGVLARLRAAVLARGT